jgi:iron complex transport system substrate-binding protein
VETILAIPGITHVVVEEGLLPETIREKLDGIEVISVPLAFTAQGAKNFISQLGKAFGKTATANEINQKITTDLALLSKVPEKSNLLFLYGRGAGAISAAGKQTIQNAYIEIIGATNACAAFDGFKLLSPEVLAASSPSHILLFDHTFELLGGAEGIAAIPGIKATTAGMNSNYIVLESSLLGNFGPRLVEAALAISKSVQ